MIERRSGRFVGVASVAGLRGLPTSGPYSASKAAVQAFLEAARIELVPYHVGVTIVNPGFVVTEMTAKNRFHMPFLMKAPKAARIIADGIERGKRVIEFPRPHVAAHAHHATDPRRALREDDGAGRKAQDDKSVGRSQQRPPLSSRA